VSNLVDRHGNQFLLRGDREVTLLLLLSVLLAAQRPARVPEPLILDMNGDGLSLTTVRDGVRFDLDADGKAEQTAWTAPGADEAFLVIDENKNGRIDNGRELLGGGTSGPPGFVALRAYDEFDAARERLTPDFGLTPRDPLFKTLLLWTDTNHNGVAEEDELESLGHAGIHLIALGYKGIDEADTRGNVTTLQARVLRDNGKGAQIARTLNAVRFGK
jgi:hypothetical protein